MKPGELMAFAAEYVSRRAGQRAGARIRRWDSRTRLNEASAEAWRTENGRTSSYAMICRIERTVSGEGLVVLRVSGRIHAGHLDTLRDLAGREKGRLAIDLEEVILVDREIISFLAVSEAGGIELRNCPAYIREWVARERTRTGEELSDWKTGASDDIEDL